MITETISCDGIPTPISRIGLGTWAIGGAMWGGADVVESIKTIQHAVDVGINLIDTAPGYGFGHSEETIGKALADGGRRDKTVLATKVGLERIDGQVRRNSSPKRIRQEIEDSLRRLRTDRIDIYQVHWPDASVPIEETAEALLGLLHEGKVLALGVSNFSTQQIDAWRRVAPLHTTQPPYNIFVREIESDVLPYALKHQLIVLSFAVRWILDRGETMTALWGARNAAQLDQVEEAFGWKLSPEDYAAVDDILRKTIQDPVGPEFMAPPVG
jgi:aryl-alcohol dehydrogenase-like predicted oxidoreductase